MLKQFLSKLPRKSSKSEPVDSPRNSSRSDSSSFRGAIQRTHSGTVVSGRPNAVKRMSSAVYPASVVAGIEPLLAFKDVPSSERMTLFISKLSLCSVVFDFNDLSKNIVEKDIKRVTLIELHEFVTSGPPRFTEPAILAMCRMCASNLFRDFPPNHKFNFSGNENDDVDEPVFDPAWFHLQIVYDLLLNFIASNSLEPKLGKKYINHAFILRLLDQFDSEDPRERECLKTIMHRIYGKFMVHRRFIRRNVSNIFYRFVFETERHNGIAELLEIFGSVIPGFAYPLKEEHEIFLLKALIPLHKPKSLGMYFQQLSYCVAQFLEKEPKLTSVVIKGLLKYWPITNSHKEVMFLSELEEILEAINMGEFQKVMVPLFQRIRCCITSCHFQVAERALLLWNNDQIVSLIAHNRHVILPIIFPALEKNAQSHWNQGVLNSTLNVRTMFVEMDEALFVACHSNFMIEQARRSLEEADRKEAWEHLENEASRHPIVGNTAVLVIR